MLLTVQAAAAQTPADPRDATPDLRLQVHLANGRIHSGFLAWETDHTGLRLETLYGEGRIVRRIDWEQVARVEIAGSTCTGAQLRQAWMRLHADAPPSPQRPGRSYGITGPTPDPRAAEPSAAQRNPVACLTIDASLGRWNANVESTGLLVRLMPLDASGQLTPVDGTLMVELVAGPAEPYSRIGYWQQAIRAGDFDSRGAECRLNFQAVHPEFAYLPVEHAAVHVRLTVPGQGTFEATQDGVCLRPHFTPVRDFLEITQPGRAPRFLPDERTGRRQ